MKQQQKLTMSMAIFFLIVLVSFGTIVLNEKKGELFLPKIEKKLETYFLDNYKDLKDTTKTSIKYINNQYTMTIKSKQNEHYYFTINYKNKKIKDTYKENYIEGKNYLLYLENKLKKEIKNTLEKDVSIDILTTLDSMTTKMKDKVLKEDNVKNLEIYNLETKISIPSWEIDTITQTITDEINEYTKNNITPKTYTIILTNNNKSLKITNLNKNLINYNTLNQVIDAIINNKENSIIQENNIKYEHSN